jgi:hypothetical protein
VRARLEYGGPERRDRRTDPLRAIYEDDVLRLFWDTKGGYHVAEWHGFAKGERLRHAAHACIYAARERRSRLWLADIGDFSLIGPEDQEWIVRELYPRLVESGVRYMGVVLPVRAFAQLSVRDVNAAYGAHGPIEFEYHGTRAAAARWLGTRPD